MGRSARVLVVEDVMVMADVLCDVLRDSGFEPVGPSATVDKALHLIATSTVDAAILDIRLLDGRSFPVAYALRDRGIPFVFVTGSRAEEVPSDLKNELLIPKPPERGELAEAILRLLKR
jgi:DNA-binding response OmpR family regulator